jgi:hypothetical protein
MRRIVLAVVLASASAAVPAAGAAAEGRLAGHYSIGGKTLVDPPPDEARDTHLYLELTDDAAKALYDAMKAKAAPDACGEPGTTTKRAGGIQCSRSAQGKAHRCWIGVELRTQRIVSAVVC